MADMKNIRKKGEGDLKKMLKEKREALRDFRFAGAGGRTRNVREGRGLRHEIAQILTAINENKVAKDSKDA
jgi:ribosomal protein L29